MGYWNTRGLRGSTLEELINMTNDIYEEKGIALVSKIPTPIKPIKIDKKTGQITLAYFDQKSTVDYQGVVQGIPICFDAKETSKNFLPLANVHQHQIDYMRAFEKQDGIAFFIVYFTSKSETFLLPFKDLYYYYLRAQDGGKKSIAYDEFKEDYKVPNQQGVYMHYLVPFQTYLSKVEG